MQKASEHSPSNMLEISAYMPINVKHSPKAAALKTQAAIAI